MARQSKKITIVENDKNLEFVIEQMPATKGFLFGAKVARFVCNNHADVKDVSGTIDLLVRAIGGVDLKDFESIVNEALSSVKYTSGVSPQVCSDGALDAILEDPANVFVLVKASLEVNLAFIGRAIPHEFREKIRGALREAGSNLQTSSKEEK